MSDDAGRAVPGWRLGRLAGVPVYLSKSWLLIAGVVVAMFGPTIARGWPELGTLAYVVALGYAVALLGSVLVHELAHALTAKALGMQPNHIALTLWGGHTQFQAEALRPGSSFLVAFAGPLANLALAGIAWLSQSADLPSLLSGLIYGLMWTNAFVGLFNLLPGLPLDGGAMLEAAIWQGTGSRAKGTRAAAYLGMAAAVAVVIWGTRSLWQSGRLPSLFSLVWTLMISSMLWQSARQSLAISRWRQRADDLDISRLMVPAVAMPWTTVLAVVAQSVPASSAVVVLDDAGRPTALVDPDAYTAAVTAGRLDLRLDAVSRRIGTASVIDVATPGDVVMQRLAADPSAMLVVTHAGSVVGVLPPDRVAEAITG